MRNSVIRENRNLMGRFRGGKLAPVAAHGFKQGEGGMLSQSVMLELDPVGGRLITPVTAQVFCVYVPLQALDVLKNPDDENAGITEVMRRRALEGQPLFGLTDESEISKRLGIHPRSIGGVLQVSEVIDLAHNCAVNFLRKQVYTYAAQLTKANRAMTPALLSSTVLDRFNAVLNPDDHINGIVTFDEAGSIPVKGLAIEGNPTYTATTGGRDSAGDTVDYAKDVWAGQSTGGAVNIEVEGTYPKVRVELSEAVGGMSLTDLYNAETMDRLTRKMRAIIDANPQDGEEQVVRWAYGLSVDTGRNPWLLYQSEVIFGQDMLKAMDGAGIEAEVTQTRLMQRLSWTVPVPKTELGGVVITFCAVKPDETIAEQPHPVLSDSWAFDNLIAEELQLDPVPVLGRELDASIAQADEAKVCFYTGYNELRRLYVNYGLNREIDPSTIDSKNALWQLEIPASVTPENIIYPEDLPQYPFLDQEAEICRYMVSSVFTGMSPIFIGPSPVETVAVIESEDLFGDADA